MKNNRKSLFVANLVILLLLVTVTTPLVEGDPVTAVFGGTGAGNGQFESPRGVKIVGDLIYVSDFDNDRVQIFDLDGNYVNQFGNEGTGDGQLDGPEGITYYDSKIYVAEFGNSRISVFQPDGTFIEKFGVSGTNPGELSQVFEVVINDDWMYVSNRANDEVTAFNATDFSYLGSIGTIGLSTSYQKLQLPHGIALDDTYLYVTDFINNSIKVYLQQSDTFMFHFGDNDQTPGSLSSPFDVEVFGDTLIVSDFDGLKFFDKQGNFIGEYIDKIETPRFNHATDRYLVVSDDFTNQVYLLNMVGNPIDVTPTAGQTSITITWDSNNEGGLFDTASYKVYRNGEFLAETSDKFFIDGTAIPNVPYTYSVQAMGTIGISDIVEAATSITLGGLVTVTVNGTETETITASDEGNSFPVPLSITPILAMLLLVPIIRNKFQKKSNNQ